VPLPKIQNIERRSINTKKQLTTIHIFVGIYANRLLFDVMAQKLQVVMEALDRESIIVTNELSSPPSLRANPDEEPVFASDPKGPKVHFVIDHVCDDSTCCTSSSSTSRDDDDDIRMTCPTEDTLPRQRQSTRNSTRKEFADVGASDGMLDAFTPSGFLKLIENTGTNMTNFSEIEDLLCDKLQVELMLHQQHALSFMYKMEHLEHGINSLIWEERAFPEGGRYFYSPALGQLRLNIGDSTEPVRGGILADEMGL
jgi:hypothetical protein